MGKKTTMLMILDGFGFNDNPEGNAIAGAKKPNIDKLMMTCPMSKISASGAAVGLPDGQMGNSEVGHTNIGAGRIVYQPLELINMFIKDKSFYENEVLLDVINHVKTNNSKLHIMGLLSLV